MDGNLWKIEMKYEFVFILHDRAIIVWVVSSVIIGLRVSFINCQYMDKWWEALVVRAVEFNVMIKSFV
jgi:hypothetical protein